MSPLLDRFMPEYDVVERHSAAINASPSVVLEAAADLDLQQSRIIRSIFGARAAILGARADTTERPRGLLALTMSLGWRVLAATPGREIVVGAVTQPWKANVVFRALPRETFREFRQPGHVKIVWTLSAEPDGPGRSIFRTETRAVATDPASRRKFRWYWTFFSPGIVLIRHVMLRMLRTEVEHRARRVAPPMTAAAMAAGASTR